MLHSGRASCTVALSTFLAIWPGIAVTGALSDRDDKGKKPSLSLKVTPALAIAPARVHASVEIRGGPDDYEEFYCPTVEWDWGDDTRSESVQDCQPYEAGHSTIARRFATDHVYRTSGQYKITFRMKRKDKAFASVVANVQVQPGLTER